MLTELINLEKIFTPQLKELSLRPKKGLHILVQPNEDGNIPPKIPLEHTFYFENDGQTPLNPLGVQCMKLQEEAWSLESNKRWDNNNKKIESCSPYCVAFKRKYFEGMEKGERVDSNREEPLQDLFEVYFQKAESEMGFDPEIHDSIHGFVRFFTSGNWVAALHDILAVRDERFNAKTSSPAGEALKNQYKPLGEKDIIAFYLSLSSSSTETQDRYQKAYKNYLDKNLFNTSDYNVICPDDVYGTNNFKNGFNKDKPFLRHLTAIFDISGRISLSSAYALFEVQKLLSRKGLPNPLPLFIDDTTNEQVMALYQDDSSLGFRDVIKLLYKNDIEPHSFYLLHWSHVKGITFNDLDYVSAFRYHLNGNSGLVIENYFNAGGKKGAFKGHDVITIKTIFDLEDHVLKPLIAGDRGQVKYFYNDQSKNPLESYRRKRHTAQSYLKYRKAIYEYIYISKQSSLNSRSFKELIFNGIMDDLMDNDEQSIKEKLNFWYSLNEYFQYQPLKITDTTMASQLKSYRDFLAINLITDNCDTDASDEKFAYVTGQVIYYLSQKSQSKDKNLLLQPYLQVRTCRALQNKIADQYNRCMHENFTDAFKRVAAFVMSYEVTGDMKTLHPQLLSGFFDENQLFSKK